MSTKQKEEQLKMLPAKEENFDLMLRNKIKIEGKPKHFSNSEWIIRFWIFSIDRRIYQTSTRRKWLFSTLWAGSELNMSKNLTSSVILIWGEKRLWERVPLMFHILLGTNFWNILIIYVKESTKIFDLSWLI